MQLRARGRILTVGGKAVLVARCPLCGHEHRYDKGPVGGEAVSALEEQGFSEEWLPCQYDLPGNFWRIEVRGDGSRSSGRGRPRRAKPVRNGPKTEGRPGDDRSRPGRPA